MKEAETVSLLYHLSQDKTVPPTLDLCDPLSPVEREIAAHMSTSISIRSLCRNQIDCKHVIGRQGCRLVASTLQIRHLRHWHAQRRPSTCNAGSPPRKFLPHRPQTRRHHRHPALQRTHHRISSQQCLHIVLRVQLALHSCIRHAARLINDVCKLLPPRVRPGGEELVCV